mmetsp:Transcript_78468/g.227780  ORF Transcript_78468/g.227780 Transcript_78468/m.227780 type:complete len:346 (+) Transcript_78468:87-1124(+)
MILRSTKLSLTMAACFLDPVAALSTVTPRISERSFRYVPYGESAPSTNDGLPTITCDGRVPGATLEVTHWTDNETPDALYEDTSTGMAIQLAKQQEDFSVYDKALVLNNHYDTDGVCSVWACLQPEMALKYETLLISGAEAGDFGEWTSDDGVKLDLAISELWSDDEERAYEKALSMMPDLLKEIKENNGEKFKDLWQSSYAQALDDWDDICRGSITLRKGTDQIAIVEEKTPSSYLSPYALHRGLCEKGLWDGCTRILRVNALENGKNKFVFEKIGHGWVMKLVHRHHVPDADTDALVNLLNEKLGTDSWAPKGPSGLVSVCRTRGGISCSIEEVVSILDEAEA